MQTQHRLPTSFSTPKYTPHAYVHRHDVFIQWEIIYRNIYFEYYVLIPCTVPAF